MEVEMMLGAMMLSAGRRLQAYTSAARQPGARSAYALGATHLFLFIGRPPNALFPE